MQVDVIEHDVNILYGSFRNKEKEVHRLNLQWQFCNFCNFAVLVGKHFVSILCDQINQTTKAFKVFGCYIRHLVM